MCGLSFCEGSDRALDIFGGHDIWKAPLIETLKFWREVKIVKSGP